VGAAAAALPCGAGTAAFFRRYWSKAALAWLSAAPGADGVAGEDLAGLGIVCSFLKENLSN
jgi:hypothetical protein